MRPLLNPSPDFQVPPGFRVGVIFDDSLRSDTTGRYALKYLARWCTAVHIRPAELNGVARESYDLFVHIDDGLDYALPATVFPRAWWVIDTHLNYDRDLHRAQGYDWVFVAQKTDAQRFLEAGIVNVWWLPLAGDPELSIAPGEMLWDFSFVGHWDGSVFDERRVYLEAVSMVGNGYIGQSPPDAMYAIYGQSRSVFNPPVRNDLNMRVFEAMAAGSVLVTKRLRDNGMEDLFTEGVHFLGYDTPEEAAWTVRRVMEMGEPERRQIAAAAQALARERDSYGHRMGALLETTRQNPGIQAQYFQHVRQEILGLVPMQASAILDVGCAVGNLGRALKERQTCEVAGIETHPAAAAVARRWLDRVWDQDVDTVLDELPSAAFDCVVAADVLEHLPDPWSTLRRLAEKLSPAPHARLIVSLPNAAHWSVVLPLLQGEWQYQDAGILDATHLRFFTPASVGRLVAGAGLKPAGVYHTEWRQAPGAVASSDPLLSDWQQKWANVYQIIVVCERRD